MAAPLAESAHDDVAQSPGRRRAQPASAVGTCRRCWMRCRPAPASGVFVHNLLEWMAHTGFAAVAANPSALRDRVARGCALRQWPQLIDPLTEQLLAWLHPAGPGAGHPGRAGRLSGRTGILVCRPAVAAADAGRPHRAMLLPGPAARRWPPTRSTACSKALPTWCCVTTAAITWWITKPTGWARCAHRLRPGRAGRRRWPSRATTLQTAIYLLALHRHLRERLPDYQCERHLGGALYLFCAAGTATATACGMPAPAPPRWTRWTSCLPGPRMSPRRICPPAAKDAP